MTTPVKDANATPSALGVPFKAFLILGIPLAPYASLEGIRDQAKEHPFIALLCVASYEGVLFLSGIAGKVWAKLEPAIVDHVVERLKRRHKDWKFNYRKDYLEHVDYHCRDFASASQSSMTVGSLVNPAAFLALAIKPDLPQRPASVFGSTVSCGFVVTTIGYCGAAWVVARAVALGAR